MCTILGQLMNRSPDVQFRTGDEADSLMCCVIRSSADHPLIALLSLFEVDEIFGSDEVAESGSDFVSVSDFSSIRCFFLGAET